jgi:predicted transcriptional regulator YheO
MDEHAALEFLKQVVKALAAMLGDRCEVVLHDLHRPESSIVAIEHGEITGRKVGDPSTNLGLPILKNPYGDYDQYNYRSRSPSGRLLKSSSVYFKNGEGRVFAALCINWDISTLSAAAEALADLVGTKEQIDEHFATDVHDLVGTLVDQALSLVNKPVEHMDKDDKLRVLEWLDDRGVFTVKRALDWVAQVLGISRATAYAYLSLIQARREGLAAFNRPGDGAEASND